MSTSVHFPKGLLEELDALAAAQGVSRNKVIVEACQYATRSQRQWPDRFFENDHLTAEELAELRDSAESFTSSILTARRTRSVAPL
jgi:metal-responsive CopG/Arc/MetJ family transcriptional regulator